MSTMTSSMQGTKLSVAPRVRSVRAAAVTSAAVHGHKNPYAGA